jgi:hypothetical protein
MRLIARRVALVLSLLAAGGGGVLAATSLGWAQGGGRNRQSTLIAPNSPYDGRYTFARIRYTIAGGGGFRQDIKWAHDYPRGERHFTKILGELSTVSVRTLESNILALDDPELCKYPVAYLAEAGYWRPSDAEVLGLRNYLLKGGFIIFDDFAGSDWMNFEVQMRRVLPALRPMRLTTADRIFDSFYRIGSLEYNHPYYGMKSEFWGIYENNDRSGRLLAVINYNNDMSEYWEFSDEAFFPVNMSNEAYKLGVNYLIYALTR